MIVFERERVCIAMPPHTASGMLHRVCHSLGALFVVGPTPDGWGFDQHFIGRCASWEGFKLAIVVRRPQERFVGLYYHHHWYCATQGWEPLTIEQFAADVANDNTETLSWFYRYNQARWLGNHECDVILRHDTLATDLSRLVGYEIRLPPAPANHPTWQGVWNREIDQTLQAWLAADIHLLSNA